MGRGYLGGAGGAIASGPVSIGSSSTRDPSNPDTTMFDLILRGATAYDGSGTPGRTADVAVRDGRVAEVGRVDGAARETVDATGLALMPGIVDLHTHYDAQVTWDRTLSPSPSRRPPPSSAAAASASRRVRGPARDDAAEPVGGQGMDLDVLAAGTRQPSPSPNISRSGG